MPGRGASWGLAHTCTHPQVAHFTAGMSGRLSLGMWDSARDPIQGRLLYHRVMPEIPVLYFSIQGEAP